MLPTSHTPYLSTCEMQQLQGPKTTFPFKFTKNRQEEGKDTKLPFTWRQADFEIWEIFNFQPCPSAKGRRDPVQALYGSTYPRIHQLVNERQEHAQNPRQSWRKGRKLKYIVIRSTAQGSGESKDERNAVRAGGKKRGPRVSSRLPSGSVITGTARPSVVSSLPMQSASAVTSCAFQSS